MKNSSSRIDDWQDSLTPFLLLFIIPCSIFDIQIHVPMRNKHMVPHTP